MNFLMRSASTSAAEHIPTATPRRATSSMSPSSNASKPPVITLEGLTAEDKVFNTIEEQTSDVSEFGGENEGMVSAMSAEDNIPQITDKHIDVKADEGWIIIPYREQVHILACLLASKKDTEIITPFKVAAVMNKNGSGNSADNHYKDIVDKDKLVSEAAQVSPDDHTDPINGDSQRIIITVKQMYMRMNLCLELKITKDKLKDCCRDLMTLTFLFESLNQVSHCGQADVLQTHLRQEIQMGQEMRKLKDQQFP